MASHQYLGVGFGRNVTATRGPAVVEAMLDDTGFLDGTTATLPAMGRKAVFKYTETLELFWELRGTGINRFTVDNPLVVDIYECVSNRNEFGSYNHPANALANFAGNVDATLKEYILPTAGATLSAALPNTKGITPFDYPNLTKYWKIVNVQRYTIAATHDKDDVDTGTDELETKHFHYVLKTKDTYREREYGQLACKKGVTKTLFFVIGSKVNISTNWPTAAETFNIHFSGFKKFNVTSPAFQSGGQNFVVKESKTIN